MFIRAPLLETINMHGGRLMASVEKHCQCQQQEVPVYTAENLMGKLILIHKWHAAARNKIQTWCRMLKKEMLCPADLMSHTHAWCI